jgi:hypothetical protein
MGSVRCHLIRMIYGIPVYLVDTEFNNPCVR